MTPFILQHDDIMGKLIPDTIYEDYLIAKRFMEQLPEPTLEIAPATLRSNYKPYKCLWSCHGLVRGLKPLLSPNWNVVDGYFKKTGYDHAWLYINTKVEDKRYKFILDIYPIACLGGPLLVDVGATHYAWNDSYIESRINYTEEHFKLFEEEGLQAFKAYINASINQET